VGGNAIAVSGTKFSTATYNYDAPASLATIAGAWTLSLTDGTTLNTTISTIGVLTGSSPSGCTYSGVLAPRSSGKNVFNVTLSSGPAPCTYPNLSASGVGIAFATGAGTMQLMFATTNSARTIGIAAYGDR